MKKWICLLFCLSVFKVYGAEPLMLPDDSKAKIIVNNRVLAKVNDKPITVVDVMKKMDIIFFQSFPEYAASKTARHQFYLINWKSVLEDLIDKELVLADAEEHKMEVTNGDVRQEIEKLFGPNIIANLDKIGLTLTDAWKIVQSDIVIRRMMMARVNARVVRQINPQDVKVAYDEYVKQFDRYEEWVYQVIAVRDADASVGKAAAYSIYNLLTKEKSSLDDVNTVVKERELFAPTTTLNISKEFKHKDSELSSAYKEILLKMDKGAYSEPMAQSSRSDKSTVYRIFYLKDKVVTAPLTFNAIATKLHDKLIGDAVELETTAYLKRIRGHYGVRDEDIFKSIPSDFQPFILK